MLPAESGCFVNAYDAYRNLPVLVNILSLTSPTLSLMRDFLTRQ